MLLERRVSVSLVRALTGFHGGLQHWVRCVLGTGCPGSTAGRASDGRIYFTGSARSGDRPTAPLSSFERERERKENTRSSYRPCSSFPSLPSSQAHFSRRSDAVDSSVNMLVTRTRERARIVARRRSSWMGLARKWIINILAGESVIVRCLRTSVEGRVPLSARTFHPSQLFLQAAQLCNRLNLCNES